MAVKLTPANEALAFRIWAYSNPIGWNHTIPKIAEALDVPTGRVRAIMVLKGWGSRVPAGRLSDFSTSPTQRFVGGSTLSAFDNLEPVTLPRAMAPEGLE